MLLPYLLLRYFVNLDVDSVLEEIKLTKNYQEMKILRSLFLD